MQSEHPSIFFDVLRQAEILDVHFKEIYDLIYSKENNYDSTMLALDASTKLTDKLEVRYSCLAHHFGEEEKGVGLVSTLGKRLKMPNLWTECAKVAVKQHMKGEKFYEVIPEKQLDFIEKVHKSKLGLKGMKIVVMCDKYKDGAFPKNVNFDILGENCIKSINGKYIKDKYGIEEGIYLKQKLYEERINWLKNINI